MQGRTQTTGTPGLSLWKWALLPLMLAVIGMAYLWLGDLRNFPSPSTARIVVWHVPMAMLSVVWFVFAAILGLRYLLTRDLAFDERSTAACEVGLLTTVLATLTGAIFSKMQWAGGLNSPWYAGYWQWDPKQIAILIVIIIYAAYFALRMSVDEPRRRAPLASVYAILAAASVPFLYWVLPQLPAFDSLHPQDVIRQGMDTPYRVTFWLSTLGFLGICAWLYQLKTRLVELTRRMETRAAEADAPAGVVRRATRNPLAETGAGQGRS